MTLLDTFGKIIISARLINAIVLWSLCALPFAQLDAIVLLSTLVGSLVFQGNKCIKIMYNNNVYSYFICRSGRFIGLIILERFSNQSIYSMIN